MKDRFAGFAQRECFVCHNGIDNIRKARTISIGNRMGLIMHERCAEAFAEVIAEQAHNEEVMRKAEELHIDASIFEKVLQAGYRLVPADETEVMHKASAVPFKVRRPDNANS
jgi:hypothetical protein